MKTNDTRKERTEERYIIYDVPTIHVRKAIHIGEFTVDEVEIDVKCYSTQELLYCFEQVMKRLNKVKLGKDQ